MPVLLRIPQALERLEVGRLEHMKEVMNKYAENVKSLVPVLEKVRTLCVVR